MLAAPTSKWLMTTDVCFSLMLHVQWGDSKQMFCLVFWTAHSLRVDLFHAVFTPGPRPTEKPNVIRTIKEKEKRQIESWFLNFLLSSNT